MSCREFSFVESVLRMRHIVHYQFELTLARLIEACLAGLSVQLETEVDKRDRQRKTNTSTAAISN